MNTAIKQVDALICRYAALSASFASDENFDRAVRKVLGIVSEDLKDLRNILTAENVPHDARRAELENVLRYVAQHGHNSGMSRVQLVCELAIAGIDVCAVLREENVPQS